MPPAAGPRRLVLRRSGRCGLRHHGNHSGADGGAVHVLQRARSYQGGGGAGHVKRTGV